MTSPAGLPQHLIINHLISNIHIHQPSSWYSRHYFLSTDLTPRAIDYRASNGMAELKRQDEVRNIDLPATQQAGSTDGVLSESMLCHHTQSSRKRSFAQLRDDVPGEGQVTNDLPHQPCKRKEPGSILLSPHLGSTPSPRTAFGQGHCLLMQLPAELRELIFTHAVTEWKSPVWRTDPMLGREIPVLEKRPIRNDRFNRPPPPALTIVSRQVRNETLSLYYQVNVFECWRPLFWLKDWSQSTFIDWLESLGPERMEWLTSIVLLYKHEEELEHDVEEALRWQGFALKPGVVSSKQELSEYELCYEELGLPRHFGKKRRFDRWMAALAGSSST